MFKLFCFALTLHGLGISASDSDLQNVKLQPYNDTIQSMEMESGVNKEVAVSSSKENDAYNPRKTFPYTPAQRRSYIKKARLEALEDDSGEFEEIYSSGEDYDGEIHQRAVRPFKKLNKYFRPSSLLYGYSKAIEPSNERPTLINRFKSYFRQAPAPTMKPKVMKNDDTKYEVLFWPITSTTSDGETSTNLVPHLVVRNPAKSDEIIYAIALAKFAQNGNANIFQASKNQRPISSNKVKSKGRRKEKTKYKRKQRPQSAVNDDEVKMEHIIQSDAVGEGKTTTTARPPTVPSFLLVEDSQEDTTDDDEEDDLEINLRRAGSGSGRYRSSNYIKYFNPDYYRKRF